MNRGERRQKKSELNYGKYEIGSSNLRLKDYEQKYQSENIISILNV